MGFEQAGFDVVAAIEVDPIHAAVHKFNFPNSVVIPNSISDLSADEIRERSGIGSSEVDIVIGGPPCQGFSLIGQRVLDDPRNSLVREYLRIVVELSPKYFLFENVKGLTVGSHRQILGELVEEFETFGYTVQTPWQVLNAVNYGVPQDRKRLFLLGSKREVSAPSYPEPFSCPSASEGNLSLLAESPSCGDAIGDLPDAETFDELNDNDSVSIEAWGKPSSYAAEMRCLNDDSWHFGYRRKWNPNILTSSARTSHTEISRKRFSQTKPGNVEPISRFFKLSQEGVSNTLRAGTDSARGAFTSPRPIHYELDRCITVREMARLHGFPDWFRFQKTKWHGARQVGNAVPPPLARAIATRFIHALGAKPTTPKIILSLGDPSLLEMDMTLAANYWDVDVPIGKRDRKSGAKKRKQEDIESLREKEVEVS